MSGISIDGRSLTNDINDYATSLNTTWSSNKIIEDVAINGEIITASSFVKIGGSNIEYLMADGSTTISSGSTGNSSNIYLYNSNTTILSPPGTSQIRYNNAIQDNATEIYISHLTRDGIDIDEYLNLINEFSLIYIQDQNSSLNFIKYTVTGPITIIVNDYITIPVLKQSSSGIGSTNFSNGHNIFMSVFSNLTSVDNRITTLENKTQNETAIINETTYAGVVKSDSFKITSSTNSNEILYSDGTYNTSIYDKLNSTRVKIGQSAGESSILDENISIGHNAGNDNQADNAIAIGHNSGYIQQKSCSVSIGPFSAFDHQGLNCVSIGNESAYENQGDYCVAIGNYSGYSNQSTKSIVINADYSWTGDNTYQSQQGLFINPVRDDNTSSSKIICYNSASKELTYNDSTNLSNIATNTTNIATNTTNIATNTTNIANLKNISNWRFQAFSYYGSVPTTSNFDSASGWILNQGGSITLQTIATTNTRTLKYRVQSNSASTVNGAISGWMGTSASPSIFIRQGFKVVIGFGLGDTSTNALTRSMIGLYQANTPPVLNNTTTIASVTTPSIGIIQENSESVWSFNTRGSASSTKVATTISCQTPSTTWFVLEIFNQVNSNDVILTLTDQENNITSNVTFTAGTTSTINTTNQCYIQCQRNMSSPGGVTGSAILQTASFRMWSAT